MTPFTEMRTPKLREAALINIPLESSRAGIRTLIGLNSQSQLTAISNHLLNSPVTCNKSLHLSVPTFFNSWWFCGDAGSSKCFISIQIKHPFYFSLLFLKKFAPYLFCSVFLLFPTHPKQGWC